MQQKEETHELKDTKSPENETETDWTNYKEMGHMQGGKWRRMKYKENKR